MIGHITLKVFDIEASRRFYEAALAPLGYALVDESTGDMGHKTANFCCANKRDLWLVEGKRESGEPSFACLAFGATNKEAVGEFHRQALAHGGRDNGPPGYRPRYHPGYYAAFVLDPNGYNIEAVFDDWAEAERAAQA